MDISNSDRQIGDVSDSDPQNGDITDSESTRIMVLKMLVNGNAATESD